MSWKPLKEYLKRPAKYDALLIFLGITITGPLYVFFQEYIAFMASIPFAIILAIVGFWLIDKRDRQTEQILKDLQQAIQEARTLEARLRELNRKIQQVDRLARLAYLEGSGPPRTSSTEV